MCSWIKLKHPMILFQAGLIALLFFSPLSLWADAKGVSNDQGTSTNQKSTRDDSKPPKDGGASSDEEEPWFMGTLFAFYGQNIEPGKFLAQPYLFVINRNGTYLSDSTFIQDRNVLLLTPYIVLETGITKNIDITLDLYATYINSHDRRAFHCGDVTLYLGFQIAREQRKTWMPDLRVLVGQTFPLGRFQKLDPLLGVDEATGMGSYETTLVLIVKKTFYTCPQHPYNWNLNLQTIHSSPFALQGFNAYGGDIGTQGRIGPGEKFNANLAFEYKFNKNWGCGIDLTYTYQNRLSFFQKESGLFRGAPSSYVMTLAPEIEYSFSENLGIEGGIWFSIAGRNTPSFISSVFTLSYLF